MKDDTLSGHDELLSLSQAAALAGLAPGTLRKAAVARVGRPARLRTVKIAHDRLTTRRWLQEYLMSRDETTTYAARLSAAYQAQE
jgi:hypothetical protein